jgi:hypothetical protein
MHGRLGFDCDLKEEDETEDLKKRGEESPCPDVLHILPLLLSSRCIVRPSVLYCRREDQKMDRAGNRSSEHLHVFHQSKWKPRIGGNLILTKLFRKVGGNVQMTKKPGFSGLKAFCRFLPLLCFIGNRQHLGHHRLICRYQLRP